MTAVDTRWRDRVVGPKEQALARRGTVLTWVTVACAAAAIIAWVQYGTIAGPRWSMTLLPALAWAATATVVGSAVLAARLVVGALRSAAATSSE